MAKCHLANLFTGGKSNASEESKRRLQGSQLRNRKAIEESVQVEEGRRERRGHIEAKEQAQEKHRLQASKEGYVLMAEKRVFGPVRGLTTKKRGEVSFWWGFTSPIRLTNAEVKARGAKRTGTMQSSGKRVFSYYTFKER